MLSRERGPAIIVVVSMEIMDASPIRLAGTCALTLALCLLSLPCLANELVLEKVPPLTVEQAPTYPENLARYSLGAQVEAEPAATTASNLELSSNAQDKNTAEA